MNKQTTEIAELLASHLLKLPPDKQAEFLANAQWTTVLTDNAKRVAVQTTCLSGLFGILGTVLGFLLSSILR